MIGVTHIHSSRAANGSAALSHKHRGHAAGLASNLVFVNSEVLS